MVGLLFGSFPTQFSGMSLAKLCAHELEHLLSKLFAAQAPATPERLQGFLVDLLQTTRRLPAVQIPGDSQRNLDP